MRVGRREAVGRIETHPPYLRRIRADPCVGGICAGQAWLTRWWIRCHVSADVSGGKPHRTQAADLQMGKILADSLTRVEDVQHRSADPRGTRQEFELMVDAFGQ